MEKGYRKEKILLIAPVFFGYYQEIKNKMEELGYQVDYFCDAPGNSNLLKAVGRVNKNLLRPLTERYYKQEISPCIENKKYRYVVVIAGMTFSLLPSMLEDVKRKNPDAKWVMYQWDSEKNLPYCKSIHTFFERIYSFDDRDCKKNSMYRFMPLFYLDCYGQIRKKQKTEVKYDCCYVGTAHPKKYKEVKSMTDELKKKLPVQYIYHYMPSKLKYYYQKVMSTEFRKAKRKEFCFAKLTKEEIVNLYEASRCVLDAPQDDQSGLTIRTIECLGAGKKLITTNKNIKEYDFYREENILVIDGKIDWNSRFFSDEYVELPEIIYEKYSIENWVKELLIR